MALDITTLFDKVTSHAAASGHFDRVNQHEPTNAPGHGLTCAVWVDAITPVRSSGLAATSARLVFYVRLYTTTEQEPADLIDPNLVRATDDLMRAYVGDFQLGGAPGVRYVDVRGTHGPPLEARAGYLNVHGALYRVITITLPVIVNDLWEEAP